MAKKPVVVPGQMPEREQVPSPRERVIRHIIGDDNMDLPSPDEAIGELSRAVRRWQRTDETYQLLSGLKTQIPSGERMFPLITFNTGPKDDDQKLVLDPSGWTQKDQLALIDLVLRNISSDYHRQLAGLADAAVVAVAAINED